MARLQYSSNLPFDITRLNLDDVFAGRTTVTYAPNGAFTLDPIRYVVGSTAFDLPAHLMQVTTLVSLSNERGVSQSLMGSGFGFDGQGALLSGTIKLLWGPSAFLLGGVSVVGLSLNVADFLAAAATRSKADDAALMRAQFAGNDLVQGGALEDVYDMASGKDLIMAEDGNDLVLAGLGNDWAEGGRGNDTLLGGAGSDILKGDADADQLSGGLGNDWLLADSRFDGGTDTLTGGQGADRFVFQYDLGNTVITDFQDGRDKLVLQSVVFTSWRDLTFTQEGADLRISVNFDSLLILNTDISQITGRDVLIDSPGPEEAQTAFLTGWDYLP